MVLSLTVWYLIVLFQIVDDNVYVGGYDSNGKGRINILDSNGQHISSISSISCTGRVWYIHNKHKRNVYRLLGVESIHRSY
jgi:hypothetical protein